MAGQPQNPVGKLPVECPRCGFTQAESVFAKSTICRKCSLHIDLEKLRQPDPPEAKAGSIFDKFSKLLSRETTRRIRCFQCDHAQTVSSSATSSICPACSSYIDLRDFKIVNSFNRSIQTQGSVVVTSKGDLISPKIACGSAVIEGRLRGNLLCSGTTQIKFKGKIHGAIDSQHLQVQKGSDVEFIRPLKVKDVDICGKVSARIMAGGVVRISKTGCLEGTVYAKSITVDKGGVFQGELIIGKREMEQAELLSDSESQSSSDPRQSPLALGAAT